MTRFDQSKGDTPLVVPETFGTIDPVRLKVEGWRMRRLVAAGLDVEGAKALAERTADEGQGYQVDLHRFDQMVAAGCPPSLAAAVLG
jgi:hypothetical protein